MSRPKKKKPTFTFRMEKPVNLTEIKHLYYGRVELYEGRKMVDTGTIIFVPSGSVTAVDLSKMLKDE